MITPTQIDEWLREIEARPSSAAAIVRLIASRLAELEQANNALQAENILLHSGKKVEALESQINTLTYQLETLKRQFGGVEVQPRPDSGLSLLLVHPGGQVLRLLLPPDALHDDFQPGRITGEIDAQDPPGLQVTAANEEILFVFDSGRTVAMPVEQIPLTPGLDWQNALPVETRGRERLVLALPIGRLPLREFGVQASRRSFLRRIQTASLSGWIQRANIGTGVLQPADRTFSLSLADKDDRMVLVSREGALWSLPVGDLPYMPEEALRLSVTDYLVSAFAIQPDCDLFLLTNNGKVFHREYSWLETARSFKSSGQAVLSKTRLEAGLRIASAAAVQADDCCLLLAADGSLHLRGVRSLLDAGSVFGAAPGPGILSFCTFQG